LIQSFYLCLLSIIYEVYSKISELCLCNFFGLRTYIFNLISSKYILRYISRLIPSSILFLAILVRVFRDLYIYLIASPHTLFFVTRGNLMDTSSREGRGYVGLLPIKTPAVALLPAYVGEFREYINMQLVLPDGAPHTLHINFFFFSKIKIHIKKFKL